MKMNRKGFTLIELLAVIVILAIIALIATPIVIGIINQAREKAAVNSAYGIVDAAKLAYTESLLSAERQESGDANTLKVSGTKAESGSWEVTSDGEVIITDVVVSGYKCSNGAGSSEVTCTVNAGS